MPADEDVFDSIALQRTSPGEELPPAAMIGRLVREGKFCAAARLYSQSTGHDLVESKLAIDRLARRHGLAPINGCASHFLLLIAIAGGGLWGVFELAVIWSTR